jgi:hypothetical protein
MGEQASDTLRDLPRVIVAQRVIDKMVRGALLYPEPETGEAMIGLVVPQTGQQEPDIYILDTISPGERAVREWGKFEQGDDWQGDVFQWLYVNWETLREIRRRSYGSALAAKWDTPLMHVGDWHKHPGDMTFPSGGDAKTAWSIITDSEVPAQHIVAPIVTLYPLLTEGEKAAEQEIETTVTSEEIPRPQESTAKEEPSPAEELEEARAEEDIEVLEADSNQAIKVPLVEAGWEIQINFWYMSKRSKRFQPLTPTIWPDDRLPGLPPIAWHLAHPHRFDQEYSLLTQAGYTVDVVRWDADGKPPYEICFSIYRPGSSYVILVVTPVDYPAHMPALRTAPLVTAAEGEDLFEKLYDASKPVLMNKMPEWPWDSKRTLIELVWHIEKTFKEGGAA